MRRILLASCLWIIIGNLCAQTSVDSFSTMRAFATKVEKDEYQVFIEFSIQDGYHIFSVDQPYGSLAITPVVKFDRNPYACTYGETREMGKLIKYIDKERCKLCNYYNNEVTFTNNLIIKPFRLRKSIMVTGTITYQVASEDEVFAPIERKFSILVWIPTKALK